MTDESEQAAPVRAKAALVDPATMQVVWANTGTELAIEEIVPMAEALGAVEAMYTVAETGVARHLEAALVSTSRGSVAMVTSIYRLPDGMLLVLTENAWHAARR